ncbi:MAG: hypothetical protein LCH52_08260 [Bacteroidetes bacterium]|nr:hypothetical protein [Bacteroidota bacterium]
MSITINGKTFFLPGVYGTQEVVNLQGNSLPVFNGLLIVGEAKQGIGFDGGNGGNVIKSFSNVEDAKQFFGTSDLVNAMAEAKKGGAGVINLLCINPLTRAESKLTVDAGATTLIKFKPKSYGAAGNDHKVSVTVSTNVVTVEITKAINTVHLTQNTTNSTVLLDVESTDGFNVGDTVYLIDSDTSAEPASKTVVLIDKVNKKIKISSAYATSTATAKYSRLYKLDVANKFSKVMDKTSPTFLNDLVNFVNSTNFLEVTEINNAADVSTLVTQGGLVGLITGATKGTSPAGDIVATALMGKIEQLLEEWSNVTRGRIRLVNLLWKGVTLSELTTWKGVVQSLRTKDYSIQLIVGAALGDILQDITHASSPITRAKTMNNQDVIYVGHGIDGKPAYSSLAPYIAGLLSGSSVKKNITGDYVPAITVEKTFGRFNSDEAELYIRTGVIILVSDKNGFKIAQGINTFQDQSKTWTQDGNATYLIQQRQIVDFIYEGYREAMLPLVGADVVDETSAAAVGIGILQKYSGDGFLSSSASPNYRIQNAYREGNAIITEPEIIPLETTDFVGFKMRVLIPN